MGAAGEMTQAVLLLDNYGTESSLLHRSFRAAGFDGPVLVLDDNAFLPEDVISVYGYFCGPFRGKKGVPGIPRYFNQIEAPEYWEISGTASGGKVMDMSRERGRIYYAEPKYRRLVKVVDWKNENGKVRACDHYNIFGALCARTFFDKEEKKFCRAYFDAAGREVITENYVTGDIILNRGGKTYFFGNKTELALRVLEEMFGGTGVNAGGSESTGGGTGEKTCGIGGRKFRIFYNSLSWPFFTAERLGRGPGSGHALFWQEGPREDIPGNMKIIFGGRSSGTEAVYVQNRESYEKLLALGADPGIVHPLGFVYPFERDNTHGRDALICTNSDQIEQLTELVTLLPQLHFHIAAMTEMSSALLCMERFPHVSLYPNVRRDVLKGLFGKADFYLDINHWDEIADAVETAFMYNELILGFGKTLHNRRYTAKEHVFSRAQEMADLLRKAMADGSVMDRCLERQRKSAMTEDADAYREILAQSGNKN